jgi:hypothetical protein
MQDATEARSRSPDPDTSDKDDDNDNTASNLTVTNRINQLSAHGAELQDSVEGLRDQLSSIDDRFQRFDTRLDNIMNVITEFNRNRVEPRRESTPASDHGTIPPARILEHFLSWIEADSTLLTNVVHGKLENKDLIKLLPEEHRPKGRNHGTGILLNASGQMTMINESSANEKDFPDFNRIVYVLTVYGAVRDMYDTDHTGIGTGILLHIMRLTRWYQIDAFPLSAVRGYFLAHFRKHQKSTDPLVWMRIDSELHANYIRHPAPTAIALSSLHTGTNPRGSSRPSSPSKPRYTGINSDICINFNTEGKGCSWKACQRSHTCSNCQSDKHPQFSCKKPAAGVKL